MGVRDFSKVFQSVGEKKLKDLKGKVLAIDGSTEIYRAALGMKSIHGLTDASGKSTIHLSVIVNNVIAFKKHNINQIWVFDSTESNAHKKLEVDERRRQKNKAIKKLEKIKKAKIDLVKRTEEEELFSDDDDSEQKHKKLEDDEKKMEKRVFRPPAWMFDDVRFILDMASIPYIDTPKGTEAECVAARLTHKDVGVADIVLSQDTDPILFKARCLLRKIKGKYHMYDYKDIVEKHGINHTELIKIALVLGCDFYKDNVRPKSTRLFHGIGAKTVVRRVTNGGLDERFKDPEAKAAIKYLKRKIKMSTLKWHNKDSIPFSNKENIKLLLNWLVDVKNFNLKIWETRFKKAGLL